MVATVAWVFFWVFYGFIYIDGLLHIQLKIRPYLIFLSTLSFLEYMIKPEIPKPVFWVLFSSLLTTLTLPYSLGQAVFVELIIAYAQIKPLPSIHIELPPGLLSALHWMSFVLIFSMPSLFNRSNPFFFKRSIPAFVIWVCLALLFHDRIQYGMSWNWSLAWGLVSGVVQASLPPEMPTRWYIFWMPFIPLSALVVHADTSPGRFALWAEVLFVFRFFVYLIHLLIYFPYKYVVFPLNLFSHKWKVSSEKWHPITPWRRPSTHRMADGALCEKCRRFTTDSRLIMGSTRYLTRLEEWHDVWGTFEELKGSAMNDDATCHICHLLWNSISKQRLKEIAAGRRWLSAYFARKIRVHFSSPENGANADSGATTQRRTNLKLRPVGLRVKIWEERPLSLYTFAQLFRGDAAVGARLLIHRGKQFEDASAACQVPSTDSDKHIKLALRWLNNCRNYHPLCNGVDSSNTPTGELPSRPPRDLPTRLVYVSSVGSPKTGGKLPMIRLAPMTPRDTEVRYLAFSHCWGESKNIFMLKRENYNEFLQNIDVSRLSKNMQDAVRITQRLGYSYLWVDSLCIIQNSDGDWGREAAKMGDVYFGADCTIAATGSASSDGGCFRERPTLSMRPCKIGVSPQPEADEERALLPPWIYMRRHDVFDFERSIDRSPLNKRAWVFQERILSRRILHFGEDMLYWECCRRSASETNPTGYVYKRYPEDFTDNYTPGLDGVNTRTDLERAERAGRGMRWMGIEGTRLRPPPADFDPDAPQGSHTIWQRKRGFWKQVRKSSAEPWEADRHSSSSSNGSSDSSKLRPGSGFRDAFDRLRNKEFLPENRVGLSSFSQCWYEIVEAYTRGKLTYAKDKLVALSGITQDIEKATGYTYLAGLWKEQLLTDILWFAAEGPGRRLVEDAEADAANRYVLPAKQVTGGSWPSSQQLKEGSPIAVQSSPNPSRHLMAPTWSWASLDATVAVDLLPKNSTYEISLKKSLAEIVDASAGPVSLCGKGKALAGVLEIKGPLCKVSRVQHDGVMWFVELAENNGHAAARLFPDVAEDTSLLPTNGVPRAQYNGVMWFVELAKNSGCAAVRLFSDVAEDTSPLPTNDDNKLFCLSCVVMEADYGDEEIQGLVLRLVEKRDSMLPDVFERVGFFTTSSLKKVSSSRRELKEAPMVLAHVI